MKLTKLTLLYKYYDKVLYKNKEWMIGKAYMKTGNPKRTLTQFSKVYASDAKYEDIDEMIRQLQQQLAVNQLSNQS